MTQPIPAPATDYGELVKRLREMAEHGGAPSRLATMREAADAIEALVTRVSDCRREVDEALDRNNALHAQIEALEKERNELQGWLLAARNLLVDVVGIGDDAKAQIVQIDTLLEREGTR